MTLKDSLHYTPVELSFGTSGLRGLVTDMTDLECYINAVGFLDFLSTHESLAAGSVIAVGGDLRKSTPRIVNAVCQAIQDSGYKVQYCGLLPTPALAYWAQQNQLACIMVTGSHIPDDRNGIKFYKVSGEVLKADESAIKDCVARSRGDLYASKAATFNSGGSLATGAPEHPVEPEAQAVYVQRFLSVFPADGLTKKHIVVYQHSAVGRDMLVKLLEELGATVTAVDRSETFVSIDTENVTPDDQAYFASLAKKYPDAFAIVSTDGDSDRPFMVDETGEFHRGDVLGFIGAKELSADFAAIPVSSSDAVDTSLTTAQIAWQHTKIGSPHVIVAMQQALQDGYKHVVGWEVNGGFLTAEAIPYRAGSLEKLPTRDAFLPILLALYAALDQSVPVSQLFANLPQRFTQAGLIDNFPQESSAKIVQLLSKNDDQAAAVITDCFSTANGFTELADINTTDGVRITFANKEIAHIRPSGNAPQLRIYSVAASQDRADQIVALGLAEPSGILRRLQELA